MAYTETQHVSYGGRLKNSLGGVATGFLLFIGATVLLWWNDGRAVKTAKAINETEELCVEMDNINKVDPQFNGQVVHATGDAVTKDSLVDADFGAGAVAVKLSRKVEFYQYQEEKHEETKDNVGGSQDKTITYTYKETWTDSPVNSGSFKDPAYQNKNFVYMNFESKDTYAENVSFGAYKLNEKQVQAISGDVAADLNVTSSQISTWNKACAAVAKSRGLNASDSLVHVDGNVVYYGLNPNSPQIGDVRVTFTKVLPGAISIIAKVSGNTFTDYIAKNKKSFSRLEMGTKDASEMFENSRDENSILTWILRVLGVILVIVGLRNVFDILVSLLKVLPPLATVANLGIGLVCGVVGLVWSLLVIAIAWIFYRPLLGIVILVAVGALVYYLNKRSKAKKLAEADNAQA
ncbi:MAG: TMEM43 family protein [Paludibacteraceae bacterium]|nr:TMEM43 family protein [Paludibacteraceae bacterium]